MVVKKVHQDGPFFTMCIRRSLGCDVQALSSVPDVAYTPHESMAASGRASVLSFIHSLFLTWVFLRFRMDVVVSPAAKNMNDHVIVNCRMCFKGIN